MQSIILIVVGGAVYVYLLHPHQTPDTFQLVAGAWSRNISGSKKMNNHVAIEFFMGTDVQSRISRSIFQLNSFLKNSCDHTYSTRFWGWLTTKPTPNDLEVSSWRHFFAIEDSLDTWIR